MLHRRTETLSPEGELLETDTTQDAGAKDTRPPRRELLEKLRRLQKQQQQVEGDKSSMAKDYNDQLKDIKKELRDTLTELEDTPEEPGTIAEPDSGAV